jgi:hypothetical protein
MTKRDMKFDEITNARKALFDSGKIELRRVGLVGRMFPISPEDQSIADEYNRLADLHLKTPQ